MEDLMYVNSSVVEDWRRERKWISRWPFCCLSFRFYLIHVGKGAHVSVFVMILCHLGQMFQVLANCSILSVISFLAACVWCVTARTFTSRGQEKVFAGGELSSTFILLLHFLGSCDVNASCFPTSKSLGSWVFSAAIILLVLYTFFLLFSCWGVLMAACHTFNWFKDNVGQQCWPQLGDSPQETNRFIYYSHFG